MNEVKTGVRVDRVVLDWWIRPGPRVELAAVASVRLTDGGDFRMWFRGIRLVRKSTGEMFLRFPVDPATDRCRKCKKPNPLDAEFCGRCGCVLYPQPPKVTDVANPDNMPTRVMLTDAVVAEYERALGGV